MKAEFDSWEMWFRTPAWLAENGEMLVVPGNLKNRVSAESVLVSMEAYN